MDTNIEANISKNLVELRKAHHLKQTDLAEKIGYSDKSISRWENGTTVPDICTLARIAEFYNITVDDLIGENAVVKSSDAAHIIEQEDTVNRIAMLCLSVLTVWLVAVLIYVGLDIMKSYRFWQIFVWAVPPSAVIVYKYNINNRNIKWANTILLSLVICGLVTGTYLQLIQYNFWPLFFLIIPLEAMAVVYTLFRKRKPRKKKNSQKTEENAPHAENAVTDKKQDQKTTD